MMFTRFNGGTNTNSRANPIISTNTNLSRSLSNPI